MERGLRSNPAEWTEVKSRIEDRRQIMRRPILQLLLLADKDIVQWQQTIKVAMWHKIALITTSDVYTRRHFVNCTN